MINKNKKENGSVSALFRLLSVAGLLRLLVLITVLYIGIGIAEILISNSIGNIVDSIASDVTGSILLTALFLGGVKLIAALFQWYANNRSVEMNVRGTKGLRLKSVSAYINADYNWITKNKTGDILSRLQDDISYISSGCFGYILPNGIRSIMICAVILVFMFVQNWFLGILFIVPIILYFLVTMWGNITFQSKMAEAQQAVGDEIAQAQDVVNNRTTIKTYRLEQYSENLVDNKIQKAVKLSSKAMLAICVVFNTPDLLVYCSMILVCGFGISSVISGAMTTGAFISYLVLSKTFISEFMLIGNLVLNLPYYAENARRILHILDAPLQKEGKEEHIPENIESAVEFKNVSYSYPTNEDGIKALDGFSLTVRRGERVALVGPSGCGKSTALKLIMGICEPDAGEALLYGTHPRDWRREVFTGLVTQMSQETVLFPGTIRENILLGLKGIEKKAFDAAVSASNLGWAIKEEMLEKGIDTDVGEMGKKLSGGQRQMVAIARVLLSNPRVLLLDEATSALDIKSEYAVNEALVHALQKRTVLMVTHRLSAAKNADRIVVMEEGRAVEEGTHTQLLEMGGLYYKLWENEQKREESA